MVTGTTAGTPGSGAGTRLMWIPNKAAFRAGTVAGTEWDAANIGLYSAAFGSRTVASGPGSFTAGAYNQAIGDGSAVFGSNNTSTGVVSFVAGYYNQSAAQFSAIAGGYLNTISVNGQYGFIAGLANYVSNTAAVAMGSYSTSTGVSSFAAGYYAMASGDAAIALGQRVLASGESSIAMGNTVSSTGNSTLAFGKDSAAHGEQSLAAGWTAVARGYQSIALGTNAHAGNDGNIASIAIGSNVTSTDYASIAFGANSIASGGNAVAFGNWVQASQGNAFAIGSGPGSSASGNFRLINNSAQSLIIGLNSSVPTLFIGAGLTTSTAGYMGIGTITPAAPLDVYNKFTVNSSGSISASGTLAVFGSGTSTFAYGATFAATGGNVGIGTSSPLALFDVANKFTVNSSGNVAVSGTLRIFGDASFDNITSGTWSGNVINVTKGGLGADVTAIGAGEILYSTAATTYDSLAAGTLGYLLYANGAAAPSWISSTSLPYVSSANSYVTLQGASPGSQQIGHLSVSGNGIFGSYIGVGFGGSPPAPTEAIDVSGNIKVSSGGTYRIHDSYVIAASTTLGDYFLENPAHPR